MINGYFRFSNHSNFQSTLIYCLHLFTKIALADLTGDMHITQANRCALSYCVASICSTASSFPRQFYHRNEKQSFPCIAQAALRSPPLLVVNLIFGSVVTIKGQWPFLPSFYFILMTYLSLKVSDILHQPREISAYSLDLVSKSSFPKNMQVPQEGAPLSALCFVFSM